jgi:IS30 family transposase
MIQLLGRCTIAPGEAGQVFPWKAFCKNVACKAHARRRVEERTDGCLAVLTHQHADEALEAAEDRAVPGHWEGDLVVGAYATGYLVTLVERVTRYTLVGWSRTKEADEVTAVIIRLLRSVGVACTGITFDNGKEFARHVEIASALKADVFFARPYHSWERGTNENTNGLIRRLYPKSESFAALNAVDLQRIDTFLNDRPRKCLGWATPREVIDAVRLMLRTKHYSIRTEHAYLGWIRRYIAENGRRHPKERRCSR